jgi:hypothetical protein
MDRDIRIDVWDEDSVSNADQIGLQSFPVRKILLKEDIVLRDYKARPDPPRPAHFPALFLLHPRGPLMPALQH